MSSRSVDTAISINYALRTGRNGGLGGGTDSVSGGELRQDDKRPHLAPRSRSTILILYTRAYLEIASLGSYSNGGNHAPKPRDAFQFYLGELLFLDAYSLGFSWA